MRTGSQSIRELLVVDTTGGKIWKNIRATKFMLHNTICKNIKKITIQQGILNRVGIIFKLIKLTIKRYDEIHRS